MNYAENEDAKCITVVERGPLNDLLCNAADSVKEAKRLREENAALLAEVEALDKLVAADAKVRAAASALLAILQEPVWGRNNWGIRKTDAMAALDAALNG